MKADINAVQILIFELSTPFFSGSPPLPPLSLSCYYGSEQRFFVGFSKERSREGVLQNCTHGCLLKNNFWARSSQTKKDDDGGNALAKKLFTSNSSFRSEFYTLLHFICIDFCTTPKKFPFLLPQPIFSLAHFSLLSKSLFNFHPIFYSKNQVNDPFGIIRKLYKNTSKTCCKRPKSDSEYVGQKACVWKWKVSAFVKNFVALLASKNAFMSYQNQGVSCFAKDAYCCLQQNKEIFNATKNISLYSL